MDKRRIGIILNGVTGRMGSNQHLLRSLAAIRDSGGVVAGDGLRLLPDVILVGREQERLQELAERSGFPETATDLNQVLNNPRYEVFFDASGTSFRAGFLDRAIAAGKAIYCEKPVATDLQTALRLASDCEQAGLPNGVVQDKLWLPGVCTLRTLRDEGFFGRILSVRGEFGYWVFTGHDPAEPPQRPSWNYRGADGGGIILDMLCHWRYLIDDLFGEVRSVSCLGAQHLPERVDESVQPYACTADDACYVTMECESGVICQFNSSWTVRVRRDDLLTIQVDGTAGSAVAGLRDCYVQSHQQTPRPFWNPDAEQPLDFFADWKRIAAPPDQINAFRAQWEAFLKHVAVGEPFPWTLRAGAKGVQLAECALQSWQERRWVDLDSI